MFQPQLSESHSKETQARWELRHALAETLGMGERGTSSTRTSGGQVRRGLTACCGIPRRLWLYGTETMVKQSHLCKLNLQLADNKGLQFLPPVPRHTGLGCCGERTDRGTDCWGKQRRAGGSCGWPLLLDERHMFSTWANLKVGTQLHGQAEADTCSAVPRTELAGCVWAPAQKPHSWAGRRHLALQSRPV